MRTLNVELSDRSYPIHIGPGLLQKSDGIVAHLPQKRVAVVTNDIVAPLYLATVTRAFSECGIQVLPIVLHDGEAHKNGQTLDFIFDRLLEARCERQTTIVALGGGVVGDIAGFAAAVYQRGVPFVQIPTTLLAQVDSAVGGKTAINHPLGKNMIGAFYQPRVVLADTDTLHTLPERDLSAGLAEVIKYGLIRDRPFFDWLEENMERLLAKDPEALTYAIEQSCRNKAEVVAVDERETGVRALLNFGHTFGHAIEAGTGYGTWLHGEAVGAGMVLAAQLSAKTGRLARADVTRMIELLARAQIPLRAPDLGVDRYLELMAHDKKTAGGRIQYILLEAIGEAVLSEAPADAVASVLTQHQLDG